MTNNADTWLIVPIFNEAPVIGEVIRELGQEFANIACVDDGSNDGSSDQAARHGAHVIRHPVNLGQGAAIQTGVEYAVSQSRAEYFVTFDADGQHQIADVKRMLGRIRNEPVDIILGTRNKRGAHIPLSKRLVLWCVTKLSPASRGLGLTDVHNGLRVFNRAVARELTITVSGMGHASEIVSMIRRNGWRATEEPVTILYTEHSRSKGQSLLNGVNILFELTLRARSGR